MFQNKTALALLLLLPLLAACGKKDDFSKLKPNEKLIVGRIFYAEKAYEPGDFKQEKPGMLERIGNTAAGNSVGGKMSLCFEIVAEYRDECVYLDTFDLDPRDYKEREKNPYMAGRNLFSFPATGDAIKFTRFSVGGKYYTIKDAKPLAINDAKIAYIGDMLITLHKSETPGLFKLGISTMNNIGSATASLGKRISIPGGTRVDARILDVEGISYETSVRVYK